MQHGSNVALTEGVLVFCCLGSLFDRKARNSCLSSLTASVAREGETANCNAAASTQFMSLRVVRGPLDVRENEVILQHYNRLSGTNIPLGEYLHWVQEGPVGPAWHVLLEDDSSRIVGHSSVIPLRSRFGERQILAGKSEYSFILEEFRSAKIRGFEHLGKIRNAIMVYELFQKCQAEGFGPLVISTSSARQRSLGLVGCASVGFPVSECLLTLRPLNAAKTTPNLARWERVSLGLAGALQRSAWSLAGTFQQDSRKIHDAPVGQGISTEQSPAALRFFQDSASARWRYLEGQYEQLAIEEKTDPYVILKTGAADRYLRVCQWRLGPEQPTSKLIAKLVQLAKKQQALGVRWAVYGDEESARNLARRLRRFGFLCARRMRTLLIFSEEREFLSVGAWDLTDALFSFDP